MKRQLKPEQQQELLEILQHRFEQNMKRHRGISWSDVETRLLENPEKLWTLSQMEETGGEPDVVAKDGETGAFVFFDCATETPKGRRSLCYDNKALDARKQAKPVGSAVDKATAMGIELLSEMQYRKLQDLGSFDTKTSSWLKTPLDIRELGGAIFGDKRYNQVFIYHNGADSYYAARGFRGCLNV